MTTETTSLAAWLLEQIEADEARVYGWDGDARCKVATVWTGLDPGYATVASARDGEPWIADGRRVSDASRVTILFDPARVLDQCKAHRAIVELHSSDPENCLWCKDRGECSTLRALASIYADRPGFDSRWAE